jgi:hypothetical protein
MFERRLPLLRDQANIPGPTKGNGVSANLSRAGALGSDPTQKSTGIEDTNEIIEKPFTDKGQPE